MPESENDHLGTSNAKNRNIAWILAVLIGTSAIIAPTTGVLAAVRARIGTGVLASIIVGIALSLALIVVGLSDRFDRRASRAAKLTGGIVIVALGMGTTAAVFASGAVTAVVLGIPLAAIILGCGAFTARRARPSVFGIPGSGFLVAA